MNGSVLERISQEIKGDKEVYLTNCKNNYSEYVAAAQILFPTYYSLSYLENSFSQLVEASLESKKQGDLLSELKLLETLAEQNVGLPGVYDRLAILYVKVNEPKKAQSICEKWFDSDYWMIPNMASKSLKLLKRLKKIRCQ